MAIGSGVDRLTFEGSILKALRPGRLRGQR
jgi:hypothetical protein